MLKSRVSIEETGYYLFEYLLICLFIQHLFIQFSIYLFIYLLILSFLVKCKSFYFLTLKLPDVGLWLPQFVDNFN